MSLITRNSMRYSVLLICFWSATVDSCRLDCITDNLVLHMAINPNSYNRQPTTAASPQWVGILGRVSITIDAIYFKDRHLELTGSQIESALRRCPYCRPAMWLFGAKKSPLTRIPSSRISPATRPLRVASHTGYPAGFRAEKCDRTPMCAAPLGTRPAPFLFPR